MSTKKHTQFTASRISQVARMCGLALLLFLVSLPTKSVLADGGESGEEKNSGIGFVVAPHRLVDRLLVFNYDIPFDGVTKVRMYDDAGNLLWRGQYNDEKGSKTVSFNSGKLESGKAYVFEFEYKLNIERQVVIK